MVVVALEELDEARNDTSADDLLDRRVPFCSTHTMSPVRRGRGTDRDQLTEAGGGVKLNGAVLGKDSLDHLLQVIQVCWL